MTAYREPAYVAANRRRRALANQPMPCAEGTGSGAECGKHPATLYPRGWRCADCATAAGLGLPNRTSTRNRPVHNQTQETA